MSNERHRNPNQEANQDLENLAYGAWLRRGKPIGSPGVDWEEALKLFEYQHAEQATDFSSSSVSTSPGSTPTDLGADLVPETSHDQPNSEKRAKRSSRAR